MYDWRHVKSKLFVGLVIALSMVALAPVFHLVAVIFVNGVSTLLEAGVGFFTEMPPTPLSRGLGGIAPSIVGSLLMTLLALPAVVAIALFAAILTTEFPRSRLSLLVDVVAKSLTSVPTIAVSMIVYMLVVVPTKSFSSLAGTFALVIVSLPYAYTYFSSILRSIPAMYREAAFSIAMTRWGVVTRVLVPIVARGVVAGVLITMARIMGETAALLFTAGRYRAGLNVSLWGPLDAIPLLIFDFILSPFDNLRRVAWGATFVLLLSYMLVFFATKLVVREVKL